MKSVHVYSTYEKIYDEEFSRKGTKMLHVYLGELKARWVLLESKIGMCCDLTGGGEERGRLSSKTKHDNITERGMGTDNGSRRMG